MAFANATTLGYLTLKIDTRTWFTQIEPMTIYSESESAIIALRENPKCRSRRKHVDTQYHFTRERFLRKEVQLP